MGLREWMNQWRPTTKMSKADAQEKWDWAWDPETAGALEALLQEESALQFSLPDTHSLPKAWPYAWARHDTAQRRPNQLEQMWTQSVAAMHKASTTGKWSEWVAVHLMPVRHPIMQALLLGKAYEQGCPDPGEVLQFRPSAVDEAMFSRLPYTLLLPWLHSLQPAARTHATVVLWRVYALQAIEYIGAHLDTMQPPYFQEHWDMLTTFLWESQDLHACSRVAQYLQQADAHQKSQILAWLCEWEQRQPHDAYAHTWRTTWATMLYPEYQYGAHALRAYFQQPLCTVVEWMVLTGAPAQEAFDMVLNQGPVTREDYELPGWMPRIAKKES